MKSLQAKYDEAVSRNVKSFLARSHKGLEEDVKLFSVETLESMKQRIGIRKTDTRHDTEISDALMLAAKKVGKAAKKAEKPDDSEPSTATKVLTGVAAYLGVNLKSTRSK